MTDSAVSSPIQERILVPLDGSTEAAEVLTQVAGLLRSPGAECTLLTVVERFRNPLRPLSASEVGDVERLALASAALRERTAEVEALGARVKFEVVSGVAAEAILANVDAASPSLVVMRSLARRSSSWLRGSVSQRVLRHCPAPLLILPPGQVEHPFSKILVPLDGSDTGLAVLPAVEQLARLSSSTVVLARFASGEQEFIAAGEDAGPATPARLRASLAPMKTRLEQLGTEVQLRVGFGDPAERILAVAKEEDTDLIAMTTHGRSGWSRWTFGSVADRLFSRCQRSLLVVRTGGPGLVGTQAQAGA